MFWCTEPVLVLTPSAEVVEACLVDGVMAHLVGGRRVFYFRSTSACLSWPPRVCQVRGPKNHPEERRAARTIRGD